jgi:hypothetical protein
MNAEQKTSVLETFDNLKTILRLAREDVNEGNYEAAAEALKLVEVAARKTVEKISGEK